MQIAQRQLYQLAREDLGQLVAACAYSVRESEELFGSLVMELSAPAPVYDALTTLPRWDVDRVREILLRSDSSATTADGTKADLKFVLDPTAVATTDVEGLADVVAEKNMLTAVATGGSRIADVEDHYKARRRRVTAFLASRGIEPPTNLPSLWDWHKFYGGLGGYSARRQFIGKQYDPVLEKLVPRGLAASQQREPTGWDRVDRALEKARVALSQARVEEDFQTIGLLCREVLISVASAVYDSQKHRSPDGVMPSSTDAKRMLEAYFSTEMPGDLYEAARKHARSSLDLAVALQHKRTATQRFAALCLEATSSVVNVTAIISEKREVR